MTNRVRQLFEEQGQSPWLDYIRRDMLRNGRLKRYVEEDGIRGVTANPTIFEKAIGGGEEYDAQIAELVRSGVDPDAIFEELAVSDIQSACNVLRSVYDGSDGADGFVSIEVSPEKAFQTGPTIDEAKHWWARIDRPNLFVKIPATDDGIPAIEECMAAGLNINITLIFGLDFYERVMEAYLRGLERRVERGLSVGRSASVASFFVSRVDTATDKLIEEKIAATDNAGERERLRGLLGKAAVANAKMAYQRFLAVFGSERFAKLRAHGARVQRPLWASTGTKNKAYSDVLYVDELIGPDTVNTMPPDTIDAFRDHGAVRRSVDSGLDETRRVLDALETAGISLQEITDRLQVEGVESFSKSFRSLHDITRKKAEQIRMKAGVA